MENNSSELENSSKPLEIEASSKRLKFLFEKGFFTAKEYEHSLLEIGVLPKPEDWKSFINKLMLFLGAGFAISGIFFFFAFNWNQIGPFLKFGLIEAVLFLMIILAHVKGLDSQIGQISLISASFIVGVLLAVYGQTYQTGADSYLLFLTWAGLIFGWVFISNSSILWFLFLFLLNLSLSLFWEQTSARSYDLDSTLFWLLFFFNCFSLAIWEYVDSRYPLDWYQKRWFPRILAMAAIFFLLPPTFEFIFSRNSGNLLALVFYLGGMGAFFFIYSQKIHDLGILAASSLSLIIIVTSILVRVLEFDSAFILLFLSLVVIGEASIAAFWLRKVSASWKESAHV